MKYILLIYDYQKERAARPKEENDKMYAGPERGLLLIEAIAARGELDGYHLLPAARGELRRRLGCRAEAGAAYRAALDLARLGPERRFLERRLGEVTS